jgi:hypothetical protein
MSALLTYVVLVAWYQVKAKHPGADIGPDNKARVHVATISDPRPKP